MPSAKSSNCVIINQSTLVISAGKKCLVTLSAKGRHQFLSDFTFY